MAVVDGQFPAQATSDRQSSLTIAKLVLLGFRSFIFRKPN
jgi:hypothetical protein